MFLDPSLLPDFLSDRQKQSVAGLLEAFVNPELTAIRLDRALKRPETIDWVQERLFENDEASPLLEILCRILAQSEFLTSILEREPGLLVSFTSPRDFNFSSSLEIYKKELRRHLEELHPDKPFRLALSRFKLHEIFRIAARDINNLAPIETLARELSDLADLILQSAYEKVYADTLMSHGAPMLEDGSLAEMAILSLGKHGSRELNFSSDLDLILIYPSDGKTNLEVRQEVFSKWIANHPYAGYGARPGPTARTRPLEFEVFFTEVGTRLIDMIADSGDYGSIYRIDMRLRPEGIAGPLVRTLKSALLYYNNWGQRWERQALLRARPSAGDIELGEFFLRQLDGFIYRKYVDTVEVEETLHDMRDLRFRSIALAGADPRSRRRNLKNGPGGIRDIEFLVQAVQNLYGAQYPELRRGNLFEILRRIHQSGLISSDDYRILSEGYDFLRRLEHRVQMDDMQKYHLPMEGQELDILSVGIGFTDSTQLETKLFEAMDGIHVLFQVVFCSGEKEESVSAILDQSTLTPQWSEILAGYGIREPETFFKSLRKLSTDSEAPHLNSKLRRLLKSILPRLLKTVRDTPSPDQAWRTFENLSMATPARATFYALAEEDPNLLSLAVTIGSVSPYLSDALVSSLNRIDDLAQQGFLDSPPDESGLHALYLEQEGAGEEGDCCMPCLRAFRGRNEMRIASRFALGLSNISECLAENTRLANFCLSKTINLLRFGAAPEMAILALGKFGGSELGFASDLDLIILYDDTRQADSEIPQKLASDLVVEVSKRTEDGRLFEIDMRLRPHGKSAPLVPSIRGALEYYRNEGQTWERLAMTRMRVAWGTPELREILEREIEAWLFDIPRDQILNETREMRARVEKEKPDQTLKCGPGGLLDVEFMTQAAQLACAREHPEVKAPGTLPALKGMSLAGLLTFSEYSHLTKDYLFLREIENRMSLLLGKGAKSIPADANVRDHLAGCLNVASKGKSGKATESLNGDALLERESSARQRIRNAFQSVFDRKFTVV